MNYLPTFQMKLSQDPAIKIIKTIGGLIVTVFPICTLVGLQLISEGTEQEMEIYSLSKTMGVRMSSYLVVFYIMLTANLVIFGSIFLAIFKSVLFKSSNMIILTLSMYVSTYASVTSLIFWIMGSGMIGKIIFVLINIAQISVSILFSSTPPAGILNMILIFFSPIQALNDIFRIQAIFHSKYPETGLSFYNWRELSEGNSAFNDLMISILALVVYSLSLLYTWPMVNNKNG